MKKQVRRWFQLAFIPVLVIGSLGFLPALSGAQGLLETPQPGSFQSGIGLIRGWVCSANRIDIEVVGRATLQAVYGELRGDTQGTCGDANNGFSLQVNWNELGEGNYTVRALADGTEFGQAQVTVATLGQTYLQGAQGEFVLQPFPQDGKQTRIQWQESRQLFVLSNGGTPSSGGSSPRADAKIEDPQPGSFQSGIGLVRGWVCSASRVDIELDSRTTLPAVYGQLRGDTQAACGDSNNGFSFQVNWNDVGDGTHTVRALADGTEIGRTTFTVVTLGLGSFPTGLVGNFTVDNFPQTGTQTQLQWQESQQNFVITGARVSGTCDTGVSDAPCQRVDKRILVVDPAGTGQFKFLRDAFDAVQPGDTVLLKNGTYNCPECGQTSGGYLLTAAHGGTRELPVTITSFPGHSPVIKEVITVQAPWIIIEGLRIQEVVDSGILLYHDPTFGEQAEHITIRNNVFFQNGNQGLFALGAGDLLIEKNTFERNGLGPFSCQSTWPNDNFRYVHCHGLYLSNSHEVTKNLSIRMDRVTIRQNIFLMDTGAAWGSRSSDEVRNENWLIENNLIVNHSINMGVNDLDKSVIRNNTVVQFTYAKPNYSFKTCWYLNHMQNNVIANNVCYSVLRETQTEEEAFNPIYSWAPDSTIGNTWSHNAFFTWPKLLWHWGNDLKTDFLAEYKATVNDPAALVVPLTVGDGSEAGWIDPQPQQATQGNFHLAPQSVLRGAGDPQYCPSFDLDGTPRVSGTCDIGAFTFR